MAGEMAKGAAMGSDAFFPFPDNVENAAKAGIACVIQPGGSKKDDEVIASADELGIAMVFTGTATFQTLIVQAICKITKKPGQL